MNTKKMLPLFVLVPVVVVLGVALGVLNHADTEEEDTSIALCSLDADSVITIAYKDASDGATLESALTKTDDTWTLDSDPALPLDQSKAQGVADSMTALTALRELSDDADVASMGFDTPTYELSLKTADTEWTLTVGSKNSITNNWYARLSTDGPVYTLDSSALSGICKTAKQLYAAQSITDIDVDDVTKMVVQTANGGTLSFAQNDSTWTLTDDAEYNLNQDIVKKMASTICDLKTKWSVTEPQADAVYGLDTPNAIVTLIASDGTSHTTAFVLVNGSASNTGRTALQAIKVLPPPVGTLKQRFGTPGITFWYSPKAGADFSCQNRRNAAASFFVSFSSSR